MVTRTTIGLTGLAVGILMLGALLLTQPWRASGAPPEPDWRCARLAEAAVTLRQQAEQAPVPAGIDAATDARERASAVADIKAGAAWAKRGCTGSDGGQMIPGLYRSLASGQSDTVYVPK